MANYGPCTNCTKPIQVAIFRDTGWCSENCRKALVVEAMKPRPYVKPNKKAS